MLVATTTVVVLPVVVAWSLRATGTISSPWVCAGCALLFALIASLIGRFYWEWHNSGDVVFSELLVWGWARRVQIERQVARCTRELIADADAPAAAGGSPGHAGATAPLAQAAGEGSHDHPGADGAPARGVAVAGTDERRAEILTRLAAALDAQDPYLAGHSHRVARYATGTALKLGLDADECARIQRAALIHDIGKLQVPDAVLTKPGRLTADEFELTKSHAEAGAKMAASLGDEELAEIVHHHHERFDGTGYPTGLRGEEIPLGARVIAVADTFDAVTSLRPYRPASRHKRAIEVLRAGSGSQFDPAVVHAFIQYYSGRSFAAWALVAVAPQRPFAWPLSSPATRPTSWSHLAAALGASAVVAAAAVAAPFTSGGGHAGGPPQQAIEVATMTHIPVPGHHRAAAAHAGSAITATLAADVVSHPSAHPSSDRAATHHAAAHHGASSPAASPRGSAAPGTSSPAPGTSSPAGSKPGGTTPKHGHARPPLHTPPTDTPSTTPPPNTSSSPPATITTTTSSSSSSTTTSSSTTVASGPMSKAACRKGGWQSYGFSNQGQCIAYVVHHGG
jgi:putative nucleotidyltransferase with HDIG domain